MTRTPASALLERAGTEELRHVLEQVLSRYFGAPRRVTELRRRASEYRTSFAIEELDLALDDGTSLRLIAKDLSPGALHEAARSAKPAFLQSPLREIAVYRELLGSGPLATAICYGAVAEPPRFWLFLERAPGVELYQVGEWSVWEEVARQLARFHRRHADNDDLNTLAEGKGLIAYDAGFYRLWIRRAQAFLQRRGDLRPARIRRAFLRLVDRYEAVVERLAALPATFVHGEFYASNVLVHADAAGLRVCPVDWEMAGIGPGLIDVAALVAGKWSEGQKQALALAYLGSLSAGENAPAAEDFLDALDSCRLHLAVQWLGWSADWAAPPEHRHDWLAEALALADRIGL